MSHSRFRAASRAVLALLLAVNAAHAADAVAPEPYFRHADFAQVKLSPSGDMLAALAPVNGRRGLVALDLATRKARVVAGMSDSDIRTFEWVNDRRLVFDVIDLQAGLGEQRGGGLFAIDVDGSNYRILAPTARSMQARGQFVYRYTVFARELGDGSDDILALSNEVSANYPNLYRLNTRDGRRTLVSDRWPGDPVRWVADWQGNVRAAVTTDKGLTFTSWWRPAADAPWRRIGTSGLRDASVYPVAFDADGSLVVASDVGRETLALHRFDAAKLAPGELLAAHPHADVTDVVVDRRQGRIVGAAYDDGKPGIAWFDDEWARTAAAVDRSLAGRHNVLSRGVANRVLVRSVSDTDPGTWYLLDPATRRLEFLLASRKDLRADAMPKREAVRYQARDGLAIPAVLTLPQGREPKALPLVLYVHGGPYVRGASHWTWRDEPAFLASLGYAVLEPDFRGSLGWGRRHFQAGWKQWGLAMQDDLVDGIDWLAARGTIDPKRVCIMGGSYGGYAVMMGLARDPDRFRCGVNFVGVTDIGLFFSVAWSDYANSDWIRYAAKDMVGDPDADAGRFKATSPLANAARIRAPVLMAYGGQDLRVPLVHGERMRDALRGNGTPVEWITYPDEGHGFLLEKNRFDLYGRVARFLREHLPPD